MSFIIIILTSCNAQIPLVKTKKLIGDAGITFTNTVSRNDARQQLFFTKVLWGLIYS